MLLANCVIYASFGSMKLLESIVFSNSTIFLFSRFHQISVDVVLCQNTQNIITFMVRWENFFHLTMKVCRDLERGSGTEIHPQLRRERFATLFYLGSGDLGLRFQPKKWGTEQYFVNILQSTGPNLTGVVAFC